MRPGEAQSVSVWMTTAEVPSFEPLAEDVTADVCVVGAGIAGLTTAYLLAQEGRSVVVLDDGPIGSGQTRRTTAHLSNALDDRYTEIERLHGERGARLAAESHTAAIARIASIFCEMARGARRGMRDSISAMRSPMRAWTILSESGAAMLILR